jgi:ribosome-associated protein
MTVSDAENASDAEPLRLDQFMKLTSLAQTGGQAKWMIQNGEVTLNGQVETRRRKKLSVGDVVEVAGARRVVRDATGGG